MTTGYEDYPDDEKDTDIVDLPEGPDPDIAKTEDASMDTSGMGQEVD